MNETQDSKIDLVKLIINSISNKTYKKDGVDKSYIPEELKNIYKYYINENIDALMGKHNFDQNEIDIITTKEGIIISSIFDIQLTIYCIETELGIIIKGFIDDKEVFLIQNYKNRITNRLTTYSEGKMVRNVYKSDLTNNEFTYYEGIIEDYNVGDDDLDYIAKLIPINAKFKDKEVFEFRQIKPEKRIRYVKIQTSNELIDITYFADRIFGKLKDKRQKEQAKSLKRKDK